MSNLGYDENKEPHCLYCGEKLDALRNHFHGSVAKICKYTSCGRNWQQFKIRIQNNKDSEIPEMREFAREAESAVFSLGQPAKKWDKELILVRKTTRKHKKSP